MTDQPTRAEVSAQIDASEARGETRLAQAMGEMRAGFARIDGQFVAINARFDAVNTRFDAVNMRFDAMNARIDGVERTLTGTKATVVGTGIATVAVLIGVLTYGQTWFGLGATTRDIVRATVSEMTQPHPQK